MGPAGPPGPKGPKVGVSVCIVRITPTLETHSAPLLYLQTWAELLEAWLALTSVKYHDNLLVLMLFNQWLALTMLRATGP